MELTITDAGPSKKNVKLVVTAEEIQNKYQEKIKDVRENYPIKGFRAGKVPNHLIEKKFGKSIIEELKIGFIWDGYRQLLEEHKLDLLRDPEIKPESIVLQRNQPCTIEFTVEVFPEFKMPEYKGIEVKKTAVSVGEKDIEMALQDIRKMRAELVVMENAQAEENDLVICDVNLKVDDKPVWGDQNMALGVEEFDLLGLSLPKELFAGRKAKDVVNHKVSLPADFKMADHAGKAGEFVFNIVEIKKVKLPDLNDDFAKLIGINSLEELKKHVETSIRERQEAHIHHHMEQDIVNSLMAQITMAIPDSFVEERVKAAYEETRYQMQHQGKPEEEINQYLAKEADNIKQDVMTEIKEFLLLEKIARIEKIEVSQEDVDDYIHAMSHQYGKWPNELRAEYEKKGMIEEIKYKIKTHKVLHLLRENAKVIEQKE